MQETFGRALVELWMRDGILVNEPSALVEKIVSSFSTNDGREGTASDLLIRSGVREEWNRVLRCDRSTALADRIRPLVEEPLLDLLSGDGSVSRALSDLGIARLAATERPGDYPEMLLPSHVSFRPFTDDLDLAEFDASTALMSAVLHHEPDPACLLNALARTPIPSWIVVENCVTPEFTIPFHQFADRFFNTCLNDFGVHCGDQHRTLDGWTDLLGSYGTVSVISDSFTVPGIPFPYSLIVVKR